MVTQSQARRSRASSPRQAQGSQHPPNPAGTGTGVWAGPAEDQPRGFLVGTAEGWGGWRAALGMLGDGCGTGPPGNLHDEGQVGVLAASHLPCLGGRCTGPCRVRKRGPSQAQLCLSFSSACSLFWCFGALHGAPDRSVCRRVPMVLAVPAALPARWTAPAPQPGFLRGAGHHRGNHPRISWG